MRKSNRYYIKTDEGIERIDKKVFIDSEAGGKLDLTDPLNTVSNTECFTLA